MENITINQVNALGDVDLDQDIDTDTVIASDGGVAVNGDVDDSAVNTGVNTGIIAGDDVDLDDSIVGNGNMQLNDATVGAFALGGNATNAQGENVNLGSGTLVDTHAGGDAQVTVGDGNEVQGDVSVAMAGVDGPVNLAIGDDNAQQGLEDNSTTIEDSFNLDASTNDSFNTEIDDSFNESYEDNDSYQTTVEDSFNETIEDNDVFSSVVDVDEHFTSIFEDNDTTQLLTDTDLEEVTVLGDANDIDLDA
jgi:hypothetical protein